jgi:hypothetical protein
MSSAEISRASQMLSKVKRSPRSVDSNQAQVSAKRRRARTPEPFAYRR